MRIYRSWGSNIDMPRSMLDSVLMGVEDPPALPDEIESVWLGLQIQTHGRWLVQLDDGRWWVLSHPA